MLPLGSRIAGRYRVDGAVGRGGMAFVYRVHDIARDRTVALKHARVRSGDEGRSRERAHLRFRREFHTMARLKHPRIVEVFDYGIDVEPFYTMELLDGRDLTQIAPLPYRRACVLLRDVAAALAMLHAKQLVHRDLAPGNVLWLEGDRAKLIDLGVVATVGASGESAGTLRFMAPENVRGQPIDARADLFSLGTLAYFVLSGTHAFVARSREELEAAWRRPLPPPSRYVPGIPPVLDDLVMSLLGIDRLARPTSAAEVIDRLTAIAQLDASPELEVERGYLASSAIVGRAKELVTFRDALERARLGQGSAYVLEAPSGMGKTTLLREAALEARLSHAVVLHAEGGASSGGPYGVVHALIKEVAEVAPDDALYAMAPHARLLARLFPELARLLEGVPLGPPQRRLDPREERIRAQDALAAMFEELSVRSPLVIVVDDVQRCDEASAAVLASVARRASMHRVLVLLGRRTDDDVHPPAVVRRLGQIAARIELDGLDRFATEELVRTLFGDIPNVARFAKWLHGAAGGSPFYAIELVRQLVENGEIRYAGGMWLLPREGTAQSPSEGFARALAASLDRLSSDATEIAELMAVYGNELALDLLVDLAEPNEDTVFAALDELAMRGLVIADEARARLRHAGIRETLLARIGPRARALHLHIGRRLQESAHQNVELEGATGWHLLRGGDEIAGAELLERAGMRLYESQSFHDALPSLVAALEVRRRTATSAAAWLPLQEALFAASCVSDRKVAIATADELIGQLAKRSGIGLAARLAGSANDSSHPTLIERSSALASLGLGIAQATARWAITPKHERGPKPMKAIQRLFFVFTYAAAVYSATQEVERLGRLVALMTPFASLEGKIPRACFLLVRAMHTLLTTQHMRSIREDCARVLEIADRDRNTPITEEERNMLRGGALVVRILASIVQVDPSADFARLEALGIRYFDVARQQARVAYHRWRGEMHEWQAAEKEAEALLLSLGSFWQMEVFLPIISTFAFGFCHDLLGIRRVGDELERLCKAGYKMERFRDLARAEHQAMRGDLEAARHTFEGLLGRLAPNDLMVRSHALPGYVEVMCELRDERARTIAQEALTATAHPDTGRPMPHYRIVIAIARLDAAEGQLDRAISRVDAALREAEPRNLPLVMGFLHEMRARLALLVDDRLGFELHRHEAERFLAPTHNPVLLARLDRLGDASASTAMARRPPREVDDATSVERVSSEASGQDTDGSATGLEQRLESTAGETGTSRDRGLTQVETSASEVRRPLRR